MKVQLTVVQGKPEGKVIPLAGPKFKIGRGETCHLRPNSELVSREHAEFSITPEQVSVADLGSRNGTLVNGKAISGSCALRDNDLVTVGHLTFAVSIQGAPVAAKPVAAAAPSKKGAPEDVSHDDIESWLVSDGKSPAPERPSGVYGGDTITISAFKDATAAKPAAAKTAEAKPAEATTAAAPKAVPAAKAVETKPAAAAAPTPAPPIDDVTDSEYERLPEGEGDASEGGGNDEDEDADTDDEGSAEAAPEEFIDESNPFYVKKKAPESATPTKKEYKDTSDAASDILKKMMDRRRSGG